MWVSPAPVLVSCIKSGGLETSFYLEECRSHFHRILDHLKKQSVLHILTIWPPCHLGIFRAFLPENSALVPIRTRFFRWYIFRTIYLPFQNIFKLKMPILGASGQNNTTQNTLTFATCEQLAPHFERAGILSLAESRCAWDALIIRLFVSSNLELLLSLPHKIGRFQIPLLLQKKMHFLMQFSTKSWECLFFFVLFRKLLLLLAFFLSRSSCSELALGPVAFAHLFYSGYLLSFLRWDYREFKFCGIRHSPRLVCFFTAFGCLEVYL